ncbi:hypothetical protein [Haloechinothrix salitolerans]|uniref:Uncharacterized protein n=1 Tax=Haloechinothrix salitolerans TaxID=926830 RepID=A0ABW2BS94_9PSEU
MTEHLGYAQRIRQELEEMAFVVEDAAEPGEYVVTAYGDDDLPLRPRLSLPEDVLADYLDALAADLAADAAWDTEQPLDEAISLVLINIEEELASTDLEGRNHAVHVGVRRDHAGSAQWVAEREPARDAASGAELARELEWVADPPRLDERDAQYTPPSFE